ncbi:hypothetical protein J7L05_09710 [bacterium]|nr:hypothetical protein [bacterium]
MKVNSKRTFPIITALLVLSAVIFFSSISNADELRETKKAHNLFKASLEMFANESKIPTFQGKRTVTVVKSDGMRNTFKMTDGFCKKYGGYFAEIEHGLMRSRNASPMHGPRPGEGPPPPGMNRPPPGHEPGRGMQPNMPNPNQMNPLESLKRLIDFNRPDTEPVFAGQMVAARILHEDDSHLSFKGPIEEKIAGRKTLMIEISAKNYSGNFLRLWIDKETKLPLKKVRIDTDGKIRYSTEYEKIEFVDDEDYAFKDANKRDAMPNVFDPNAGGGKKIPLELMEKEPFVELPKIKRVEGFTMISMRKMPVRLINGTHYVFSDGLNSLSIFYFDTSRLPKDKPTKQFAQKIGERLDSELPYPVLMKHDKNGFILITADMEKIDLKRITMKIATLNFEEIKRYQKEREILLRKRLRERFQQEKRNAPRNKPDR